jgi:hypothetical protein
LAAHGGRDFGSKYALRQEQREAEESSKARFHSNILNNFERLLRFVFRRFQFFQILCWIFIEILFAGFAAELDFLAFVRKNKRVTHVSAELLVRDYARLQRIRFSWLRFGALFGLFIHGKSCGGPEGKSSNQCEGRQNFQSFHKVTLC